MRLDYSRLALKLICGSAAAVMVMGEVPAQAEAVPMEAPIVIAQGGWPTPPTPPRRTVRPQYRSRQPVPPRFNRPGSTVRHAQVQLRRLGYYRGPIDGRYGPQTRAAVRNFQRRHGLIPDGRIGPATLRALNRATSSRSRSRGRVDVPQMLQGQTYQMAEALTAKWSSGPTQFT